VLCYLCPLMYSGRVMSLDVFWWSNAPYIKCITVEIIIQELK
jgi:hypothetical protein